MKKRFLCLQLNFSITQINFPLINSIHYTSKHHWHPPLMQLSDLLMIVICIITNHEDFLLSYFFSITIVMISIVVWFACWWLLCVMSTQMINFSCFPYLLYMSTSGFHNLLGCILILSTPPYSDTFHFRL